MLLKFYYAENRKIKKLSHVVTTENKHKYIHFYLYNPFGVDFFKFSKKVLEENLPRDPSGEDIAVDIEGDKVIMYDIYFLPLGIVIFPHVEFSSLWLVSFLKLDFRK